MCADNVCYLFLQSVSQCFINEVCEKVVQPAERTATTGIKRVNTVLSTCSQDGHSTAERSYLAPPWNLTLTLPTWASQLTLLTVGRPVSSLWMAMLVLMARAFTLRSNEPLSFLFEHSSWVNITRLIIMQLTKTVLCPVNTSELGLKKEQNTIK